jgi:hypothetical protein
MKISPAVKVVATSAVVLFGLMLGSGEALGMNAPMTADERAEYAKLINGSTEELEKQMNMKIAEAKKT